jgi:hypothetical protein
MSEKVETLYVPQGEELDPITVYWHNYEPGKGMVTIVCYASAWNCYFGAMSGRTIQEFFTEVDKHYLINKLGYTQWLKKSKNHDNYLGKIINAVKRELKTYSEDSIQCL